MNPDDIQLVDMVGSIVNYKRVSLVTVTVATTHSMDICVRFLTGIPASSHSMAFQVTAIILLVPEITSIRVVFPSASETRPPAISILLCTR